jgi:hypothetical protein
MNSNLIVLVSGANKGIYVAPQPSADDTSQQTTEHSERTCRREDQRARPEGGRPSAGSATGQRWPRRAPALRRTRRAARSTASASCCQSGLHAGPCAPVTCQAQKWRRRTTTKQPLFLRGQRERVVAGQSRRTRGSCVRSGSWAEGWVASTRCLAHTPVPSQTLAVHLKKCWYRATSLGRAGRAPSRG